MELPFQISLGQNFRIDILAKIVTVIRSNAAVIGTRYKHSVGPPDLRSSEVAPPQGEDRGGAAHPHGERAEALRGAQATPRARKSRIEMFYKYGLRFTVYGLLAGSA